MHQTTLTLTVVTTVLFVVVAMGSPPSYADYDTIQDFPEYYPSERLILGSLAKRNSCVPRGGSCDHKASDCCDNTHCRCNLWGANCRCQRKGFLASFTQGRSCVSPGGNCEYRAGDCCYSSVCRCNLWGKHCRCQHRNLMR